jgi:hypothetical protein
LRTRGACQTNTPVDKVDDQRPINAAMRQRAQACAWDEAGEDGEPLPPQPEGGLCGGDSLLHAVSGGRACLGLLPVVQFANGCESRRLHLRLLLTLSSC